MFEVFFEQTPPHIGSIEALAESLHIEAQAEAAVAIDVSLGAALR
jgi:hypothetical protein